MTLEQMIASKPRISVLRYCLEPARFPTHGAASGVSPRSGPAPISLGSHCPVVSVLTGQLQIWYRIELPALRANRNVTSIAPINPETGEEALLWAK